ncbi:spermatogenesis-associated protein 20 isoform X1 [Nasonia vitripennis]|uniref:Spermatogenesis-associated protein 20-like TRX domain-containing protein n=1 Tax=Nasonia vitripennis TaxID=7425 RepID=A0A7M7IRM1_NASVI|nr:spermatogenesis-associated protein 20 isoform X1 [Nasonia vitripennis]XP_016842415.1 spermatogenesis-associated protein 20 isoform X1 [Nasonia vitripennis]XP_016842416.1 spermatogenesis-associated protein 20 isoform X1 [Nasonia vitripennis]XP_016842417.1 spermatogenesis-associated protein 20 isoform X1 [Nasonia vitripennis]XP_032456038.1 spermatogenesis-associated protein 20 isoform X1 [Nasonia vitripennis]
MIWGRCCVQIIRLVSDFSKNYANSRSRGITFAECKIYSAKQAAVAHSIVSKKMSSTSSDMGNKQNKHLNKLALEKSPYLLQHATNPVDWYPWGEEALEKARREDKLIFLSVGYSTCHWCHVMEKESFENPEVAKIMNRYFVNIKVDREERPDIDRVYMTFIQSISGHGGWPMSVFLTPDLTPITGGTYFPPVDKYGQPGFSRILESIATKWIESKQDLLKSGSKILQVLKKSVESKDPEEASVPSVDCANTCVKQLINGFEPSFGGFSRAPKFPQPVNFNLLFLMYARDPTGETGKQCLNMCVHTLTKMANGGIHDHVGQGFSRYSVDGKWHVPHFEKMLYDQGQLLRSYSEAYLASKDPLFAEIVNDIVTYVARDLRHPEGGFYSAEDADSFPSFEDTEKKEGAFYVWRYEDVESLLDKVISEKEGLTLSDLFCYHFNVKPEGNVQRQQDPHGELMNQNVLIAFGSIAETAEHFKLSIDSVKAHLEKSISILFEERNKRPRPHLDDKIVTAWNGLVISGLSHAASALDNPKYTKFAEDAARFIERYLYNKDDKVLLRSCYRGDSDQILQTSVPIKGFQVDYAFAIRGLLDLYEVSFNAHWLEFAEELQDIQDSLFWDDKSGGYFSTTTDDRSVILRLKDDQDGAEPSGNSVACGNLVRLASYLDRTDLSSKAEKLLSSMQEILIQFPVACPELVTALVTLIDSTTQVYIIGKKDTDDTKQLLKVLQSKLVPGKIVMLADGVNQDNVLYKKNEVIGKMKQQNGRATAYVCHHHICSLPVTDPKDLESLLDKKSIEAMH